ncbi:MAG: hypothetical protein IPO21_18030 [Bacteroidales bacterium]|nr:hypothetical protein [Bacteroidales bacterium]
MNIILKIHKFIGVVFLLFLYSCFNSNSNKESGSVKLIDSLKSRICSVENVRDSLFLINQKQNEKHAITLRTIDSLLLIHQIPLAIDIDSADVKIRLKAINLKLHILKNTISDLSSKKEMSAELETCLINRRKDESRYRKEIHNLKIENEKLKTLCESLRNTCVEYIKATDSLSYQISILKSK